MFFLAFEEFLVVLGLNCLLMLNFDHTEASFHTDHGALGVDDLPEAPLEDIQAEDEEGDRNGILPGGLGGDDGNADEHPDGGNNSDDDAHIDT